MNVNEQVRVLRDQDPDIALLLDTYGEIDRIYKSSLRAMGIGSEPSPISVKNSAEVRISFRSGPRDRMR